MGYKNIRTFNLTKMGTKAGYCLQNCRTAFGIEKGTYASAKADMEAQKKAGTLHAGLPPTNIDAPVYVDTASKYEHIVISNHGTYYSDGKRYDIKGKAVFGWGECCDGVRVVELTKDPAPAPSAGFFPARGYWKKGDTDARIGRLATFLRKYFPAYTPAAALGNYFGPNLEKSVKEFQRRSGLVADGCVGPKTLAKLKSNGFGG